MENIFPNDIYKRDVRRGLVEGLKNFPGRRNLANLTIGEFDLLVTNS